MTKNKQTKKSSEDPSKKIDYRTTVPDESLEKIIESYERLIFVQASKHLRERVELEDLMSEGRQGIVEAYRLYTDEGTKVPDYSFHQAVMYRLTRIFYYCLNNASPLKTPIYVQRGCMHIGQIFKILGNQNAAEELFGREGPATDEEIIEFIYDEDNRMPTAEELDAGHLIYKTRTAPLKYRLKGIKKMIVRDESDEYFDQILDGVLHHRNGNRHTFVKNNLTDKGKVLHIKNKLHFCAKQNQMKYERVIELILSARVMVHEIDDNFQQDSGFDIEKEVSRKQVIERGMEVVGKEHFSIFVDSALNDMTYGKIAEKYGLKKSKVSDIISQCATKLRKDEIFQQLYEELLE